MDDGWKLVTGETLLRYESMDGYIEGVFIDVSKTLDITIESHKCNGAKCNGKVKDKYIHFKINNKR